MDAFRGRWWCMQSRTKGDHTLGDDTKGDHALGTKGDHALGDDAQWSKG